MEQVPAALPLWEAYTELFCSAGWSVWCGVVDAADYGVPQHRRRAVLLAHSARAMSRPAPSELPLTTMSEALGLPPGDMLVSTGRDWNAAKGTSQVVNGGVQPAPAVTTKSGTQWHLDVERERPRSTPGSRRLTVADALTLQSFPSDYPVAGTKGEQFKQIGNAVPPRLAERLLLAIVHDDSSATPGRS